MSKIDIGKKYRTRDGREVRLHVVDGPKQGYPVIGSVLDEDIWFLGAWGEEGEFLHGTEHKSDLVEVPQTYWINFYASGSTAVYKTEADALGCAAPSTRTVEVQVTREIKP